MGRGDLLLRDGTPNDHKGAKRRRKEKMNHFDAESVTWAAPIQQQVAGRGDAVNARYRTGEGGLRWVTPGDARLHHVTTQRKMREVADILIS